VVGCFSKCSPVDSARPVASVSERAGKTPHFRQRDRTRLPAARGFGRGKKRFQVRHNPLICDELSERTPLAQRETYVLPRGAREPFPFPPTQTHAVHETSEGPIYLWVAECEGNCWVARIEGCGISRVHIVDSRLEGSRHNNQTFSTLFPEHRCCPECVVTPF
jgi:hypothetical protein